MRNHLKARHPCQSKPTLDANCPGHNEKGLKHLESNDNIDVNEIVRYKDYFKGRDGELFYDAVMKSELADSKSN
jgi:hypothetical protein